MKNSITQKTHNVNGTNYTFKIISAEQMGCIDFKYWVICSETQFNIGTNNKRQARNLIRHINGWDWGFHNIQNQSQEVACSQSDYDKLKKELEVISENHTGNDLDALFICVSKPRNMGWVQAKKLGMKKDAYYGWMFYTTSTNSNGYKLLDKLGKACEPYNMRVMSYQL